MQIVKQFDCVFLHSEKAEWQKEKETFTEMKNKLEEENQVDTIKIQELNVSQTNKYLKVRWYFSTGRWSKSETHK